MSNCWEAESHALRSRGVRRTRFPTESAIATWSPTKNMVHALLARVPLDRYTILLLVGRYPQLGRPTGVTAISEYMLAERATEAHQPRFLRSVLRATLPSQATAMLRPLGSMAA